jgi:cytochrome c
VTFRQLLFLSPAAVLAGMAAALPAQPAKPDGAALFRQRCASCHAVAPGGRTTLGPSLHGVVGRKAAATAFNYSPALKNAGVTWNRADLDRYLQGPTKMVPGTRMVVSISDPQQRAALIDYLAHAQH